MLGRVSLLLFLAGCHELRYVIVTIEDPDRLAADADELRFGSDPTTLDERRELDGRSLPATVAMTSKSTLLGMLVVEARSGDVVRARGSASIRFDDTTPVIVRLSPPCSDPADCQNEVFCDGMEDCSLGACLPGTPPCADPELWCVDVSCLEEARACAVTIDRSVPVTNPCDIPACAENGAILSVGQYADGAPCIAAGVDQPSICVAGKCVPSICGDGVIDPRSEACDLGFEVVFCRSCRTDGASIDVVELGPDQADIIQVDPRAISPNGRFIAFNAGTFAQPTDAPIRLVDRSTGAVMVVESGTIALTARALEVSDEGDIALVSREGEISEAYLWSRATRARAPIARPAGNVRPYLAMSGSGELVSLSIQSGGGSGTVEEIYTFDLVDGTFLHLTEQLAGTLKSAIPFVSADASVAGASAVDLADDRSFSHVIDLAGGEPMTISVDALSIPALSETGRFLAYELDGKIHRLDRETGADEIVDLGLPDTRDHSPSISSSGDIVTFVREEPAQVMINFRGRGSFSIAPILPDYRFSRSGRLSSDGRILLLTAQKQGVGISNDEDLVIVTLQ